MTLRYLLTCLLVTAMSPALAVDKAQLNPKDIGGFEKRQFVDPNQAAILNKDIQRIVGRIAIQNPDGTVTISSCRKTVTPLSNLTTTDLSQPVFSALIDGKWGLTVAVPFLNLNADGNTKYSVTATDIANAVIPETAIPEGLSIPVEGCTLPTNKSLYYVQKAQLTLIAKTTYSKVGGTAGLLSFLNISGTNYEQTNQSNTYAVSVYATPIYSAMIAGASGVSIKRLAIAKTSEELVALGGQYKALGTLATGSAPQAVKFDDKFFKTTKPAALSSDLQSVLSSSASSEK